MSEAVFGPFGIRRCGSLKLDSRESSFYGMINAAGVSETLPKYSQITPISPKRKISETASELFEPKKMKGEFLENLGFADSPTRDDQENIERLQDFEFTFVPREQNKVDTLRSIIKPSEASTPKKSVTFADKEHVARFESSEASNSFRSFNEQGMEDETSMHFSPLDPQDSPVLSPFEDSPKTTLLQFGTSPPPPPANSPVDDDVSSTRSLLKLIDNFKMSPRTPQFETYSSLPVAGLRSPLVDELREIDLEIRRLQRRKEAIIGLNTTYVPSSESSRLTQFVNPAAEPMHSASEPVRKKRRTLRNLLHNIKVSFSRYNSIVDAINTSELPTAKPDTDGSERDAEKLRAALEEKTPQLHQQQSSRLTSWRFPTKTSSSSSSDSAV